MHLVGFIIRMYHDVWSPELGGGTVGNGNFVFYLYDFCWNVTLA